MTRSLTTKRAALGLFLLVACGESEMAPDVIAEATQNMLCVTAVGSRLEQVQASSKDIEPALIFRDTEDGLSFNPPWSVSVSGEPEGLRCYLFGHPYWIRGDLLVSVIADGVPTAFTVPVLASDELSLFGELLECSNIEEWQTPTGEEVRDAFGFVEAPPGTWLTWTSCDEYVLEDGVKTVVQAGCRSRRRETDPSGEAGFLCSQVRTEPDGAVVGPGYEVVYVRFDD